MDVCDRLRSTLSDLKHQPMYVLDSILATYMYVCVCVCMYVCDRLRSMHWDLKHQRMHVHKSHMSIDSAHVAYAAYMYVPPCIDGQLALMHLDFKPSIHMHLEIEN